MGDGVYNEASDDFCDLRLFLGCSGGTGRPEDLMWNLHTYRHQVGYKLLVRPTWVATTERPPMVNEDLRDIIREAILAEMRNGASSVKETDNAAEETKAGGQKTAAHKTERLDFGTSLPCILGSKDLVVREA